jgi:hypothetical protein
MIFEKTTSPTTTSTGQGSTIETSQGVTFHHLKIAGFESRGLYR